MHARLLSLAFGPRPLTNTRQRGAFVTRYLESEVAKLGSKNTIPRHRQIELLHSGKPWVADWKHWNYAAAIKATESVYTRTPDLTREGGSIPVTLTFAEQFGVNVLLLPMGRGDAGAQPSSSARTCTRSARSLSRRRARRGSTCPFTGAPREEKKVDKRKEAGEGEGGEDEKGIRTMYRVCVRF
ncbi:hypothetical protein C8R45DRAFT_1011978 [Mycena sanguinolenta]|nr:hypothetical protein C8R45DRAFT_1011978 [Mycena sanguinolenta]